MGSQMAENSGMGISATVLNTHHAHGQIRGGGGGGGGGGSRRWKTKSHALGLILPLFLLL